MFGGYTLWQIARFWSKVDTTSRPHGCWEWKGQFVNGYPAWKPNGGANETPVRAGRTAMTMKLNRALTDDEKVCHDCDWPPCMNPDHLWIGTTAQNNADAAAKGRTARGKRNGAHTQPHRLRRGEENGQAKLTVANVRHIKARLADGASLTALAKGYGVSVPTIGSIKRGKTWKHVV